MTGTTTPPAADVASRDRRRTARLGVALLLASLAAAPGAQAQDGGTAAEEGGVGAFFRNLFGGGGAAGPSSEDVPAVTGSVGGGVGALPSSGGSTSQAELTAVRDAFAAVRRREVDRAASIRDGLTDPVARKAIEWFILREAGDRATPERFMSYLRSNPLPASVVIRRRAESSLWDNRASAETVRAFFAGTRPITSKGRFALAQVQLAAGDRAAATTLVREAWHRDPLSAALETQVLERFGALLTANDHKIRMDQRFLDDDHEGGSRAAGRLGGAQVAIARARTAVIRKAANAGALIEAVPEAARSDTGYLYSRAVHFRRLERGAEAARAMLAVDAARVVDADGWWIERRALGRRLLDENDPRSAYRVVAAHGARGDAERLEAEWMAGWIALRFLSDEAAAVRHLRASLEVARTPVSRSRSLYWLGRAYEAQGASGQATSTYQEAARFATAYYGQLARVKLGQTDLPFRAAPQPGAGERAAFARTEAVRFIEILYGIGEHQLAISVYADLIPRMQSAADFALLADVARRHRDARNMVQIGKGANQRGHAFEEIAWPTFGLPQVTQFGPEIGPELQYAIARQESEFNPRTVSTANAFGLMQVTPAAGRYVARKFNQPYDESRLRNDPVYNTAMGSAELGDLIKDYGSYILSFAGYNAGRGRVRDWVAKYGDPRDPNVDPIDWIERIPFQETRNYVQRVMENVQVYRVLFSGRAKLAIDADLRRRLAAQ